MSEYTQEMLQSTMPSLPKRRDEEQTMTKKKTKKKRNIRKRQRMKKKELQQRNCLGAVIRNTTTGLNQFYNIYKGMVNPCPAEPGHTLPLQTV